MSRPEAHSASLNTIYIAGSRAVMTHQLRTQGDAGFEAATLAVSMPLTVAL